MSFFDDLLPEEIDPYNQEFMLRLQQACALDFKMQLPILPELNKTSSIAKVRQRLLEFAQGSLTESRHPPMRLISRKKGY